MKLSFTDSIISTEIINRAESWLNAMNIPKPVVTSEEDQEITFSWKKDDTWLSVYFSEGTTKYLLVKGNIRNREEGKVKDLKHVVKLYGKLHTL